MATTTTEETERLVREHFEGVWNHGEFVSDVIADDFVVHTNLGAREDHTLEAFQGFVAGAREALPDLHKEPDDVIATDGKATIRYTMTGTQEGEFQGIPPTGREIELTGVAIFRLENGEIAEAWYVADFLRAMRQLGAVD